MRLVVSVFFTIFSVLSFASGTEPISSVSQSKNILALVSDRSSGSLVVAAHRYLELQPSHQVQIRSVSQINLMSDQELVKLVNQADAILMAAIFAEPVERLLNLQYPQNQTRIVINGDRRLLSLNTDANNQLQTNHFATLSNKQKKSLFNRLTNIEEGTYVQQLADQQKKWPQFSYWLQARGYWQNRNDENRLGLLSLLSLDYEQAKNENEWPAIQPAETLRFYLNAKQKLTQNSLSALLSHQQKKPSVFILDHDTGDRPGDWQLHQRICSTLTPAIHCISVLSAWGEASINAVTAINMMTQNTQQPFVILSLQDFVVGGGDGRKQVSNLFSKINVPVFKGIRLTELNSALYDLSSQGLPADSVHYRIAMPELQGIGQAHVLALAAATDIDTVTGAQVSKTEPVAVEVSRLTQRINKWFDLQTKANKDKKVAIVFYNHPPGRHNIGADNLNVPESLWDMLNTLKKQGYDLGPADQLPTSADALLDLLQKKAVNLPEDAKALQEMSGLIHNMSA